MKTKIHIGIDPDVQKSGISCWDSETKSFDYITTLPFWHIIKEFECCDIPIHVYIEASWLIKKSNWHNRPNQSKSVGEKIAKSVGSNHQVGKLLMEYCQCKNIDYTLVKPKGKVNHQFFKKLTGYKKRTNSEMRDSAMLVFGI